MFGIQFAAGSVKKIGKEIKALVARQAAILKQRLDVAKVARDAARQARTVALVDGDPDPKAAAAANAAVAAATTDFDALSQAIGEIEVRLQDARGRLREAEESERREAAATAREADAERITSIAQDLDRSIEALATSFEALYAAIPSGAISVRFTSQFDFAPTNSVELARQVVAEGLYRRVPEMFEMIENKSLCTRAVQLRLRARTKRGLDLNLWYIPKGTPFATAAEAAEELLCGNLRKLATNIREGCASPDLPSQPPVRLAAE